jgi:organic radical activating enzyme
VVEVFSSIQGEAELVGHRQVFVRFFGCNIRCDYCDSPETLTGKPPCRVERTPGRRDFLIVENPVPRDRLTEFVRGFLNVRHHSVSLTGGEPLLHARFLEGWLPEVQALGLRVYVETNGLLPEHLERVLPWIDLIGMDVKLPSATDVNADAVWETHRRFLEIGRRKQLFVKLIVTPETTEAELDRSTALLASVDASIPLTLQPVTPFALVTAAPTPTQLLDLQARALQTLETVRVIPQTHKLMDQL